MSDQETKPPSSSPDPAAPGSPATDPTWPYINPGWPSTFEILPIPDFAKTEVQNPAVECE
jgi:hypothetical protein